MEDGLRTPTTPVDPHHAQDAANAYYYQQNAAAAFQAPFPPPSKEQYDKMMSMQREYMTGIVAQWWHACIAPDPKLVRQWRDFFGSYPVNMSTARPGRARSRSRSSSRSHSRSRRRYRSRTPSPPPRRPLPRPRYTHSSRAQRSRSSRSRSPPGPRSRSRSRDRAPLHTADSLAPDTDEAPIAAPAVSVAATEHPSPRRRQYRGGSGRNSSSVRGKAGR